MKKMESKKILWILLVIVLLIITGVSCFFLGRVSYKNSLKKYNVDYNYTDKADKRHKTYTLNETIKTDCYEICFTGFYLEEEICILSGTDNGGESHEDFFKKPTQHEKIKENYNKWYGSDSMYYYNYAKKSPEGEIFATIEYNIKNITTEPIEYNNLEATNKFSLVYDDEYTFTDNTPLSEENANAQNKNFFSKIYVEKDKTNDNGEIIKDGSNRVDAETFNLGQYNEATKHREHLGFDTNPVEKIGKVRYGNASKVRLEVRYGKDNSLFELTNIWVDYIKSPQHIRLTQEQLDLTEDTSQKMEFPDYVCQEIINELVHIVMENSSDPRMQTHPAFS